jgi:hypothetical protein
LANNYVPTDRDIQGKLFIYRMAWANTFHYCKAIYIPGPSKDGTTKPYNMTSSQCVSRLHTLTERGDLEEVKPLHRLGEGADALIRICGKKLYRKGALLYGKPYIPPPNVEHNYIHNRTVRDLFTDALVAARIAGIIVVDWKSDYTLVSDHQDYHADWFFSLQLDQGNPYMYFLEYERSPKTEKQWGDKLDRITAFCDTDHYRSVYGHYRVRWAVVAETETHANTLRQWTITYGGRSRFWFTHLNLCTPYSILTIPIWQVSGQEGLHHLTKIRQETASTTT